MRIRKGEIRDGRFVVPYRTYGEAPKTIVCVSGAQQTMAVWKSFVAYFCRDFTVVVFDLPGQGRSETLYGPAAISLDEQVSALSRVIETTKHNGPVHIAAASWGTIVAAIYAARHPDAAEKIILGGFGVKPTRAMSELIREGKRLYNENRPEDVGRLIIDRFGQDIPDSYKRRIIDQFRTMNRDKCLAFYAHVDFVESASDIKRFADLKKIRAKTLIVNGEKDAILDAEDAALAASLIRDCEVRIIPEVGHFLHFESAEILGVYDAFLA
ncbi:MAG: alpha/beta hydrolase [Hyphomicrobiales bacterium]|nr:alpha/beta hydrolase [Hyphomicrobiales bacterium]